ncbi:MAG TPA: chemotaxis protein CheA, partial [Bacillales bacterium]|nr:chemotaxis protein CheA [Bacillales bacterium]
IRAVPPVDKIEEESFESEFCVVLVSQDKAEEIHAKIMKVSEVDTVELQKIETSFQEAADPTDKSGKAVPEKKARSGGKRQASKTIRVNIDRLDQLMNLFEELVIDRGRLERISQHTDISDLTETVERMSRISSNMQEMILSLRMVPIDQVFGRFPKMVRDLSRELNKTITLKITGEDTELDRTVVDEIGDPLVHLLRNSLDHGIETPDVREKAGKPKEGVIHLKAFYSGNHVLIEIQDDGAGINRDGVLKKALENGVVTESEADKMSDREVYELLFASGFSTAETISDISGRGVGLDVVKNKIESLGGHVEVDSERGVGTTFTIQLPLTLSIIASMLIRSNNEIYAVPLSSIVEIALVEKKQIASPHGYQMMDFRGTMVPLISLREVFSSPAWEEEPDSYPVVLVRKGDKLAGLIVDDFIGHQEIVLKPLGNYFTQIPGISGATILGDGKVALIIDCNTLIR